LNLHHGINITDAFMHAVRDGAMFGLKSPKTGEVLREVNARQLWQRILETRLQTGEPYILNIDHVNRALPKHQRELGLKVNTSNLCSEITLPTGIDHLGKDRTAVCCLPPSTSKPGTNGPRCRALSKTCCACWTMS